MFISLFLRKSLKHTRKTGACLQNTLRKAMIKIGERCAGYLVHPFGKSALT
jgi:hypothetical protein